jgi:hypothetical protein
MDEKLKAIAEKLYHCQQTLTTIPPISETNPEITINDGW